MLIRYVDGPYAGETVETTAQEVHGVHTWVDRDGVNVHEAIRYRVNPHDRTASLIEPAGLKLVREASPQELLAELHRRGWRPPLFSPMHRRRPRIRSGFGAVPWPSEGG